MVLLLIVRTFLRDVVPCDLYNHRNIRNKELKKLLLKLTWLIEVPKDMYNRTGQFKKLVIRNNRAKDFVNIHLVFSCHWAKCWGYKTE